MDARRFASIGPRTRRRLGATGAALGVLALLGAGGALLARAPHRSAPNLDVASTAAAIRYETKRSKLIFGMTRRQVRRLVGPPMRVVGNCWQYPPYAETGGPNAKTIVTADRLCFAFGRYATSEFWWNGKWREPGTTYPPPGG